MTRTNERIDPHAIVSFVEAWWRDADEIPATVRDIQQGLRISSTSVVKYHLVRLADQGRLRMTPGIARSIRPARKDAA